jgi:hypothetical protein
MCLFVEETMKTFFHFFNPERNWNSYFVQIQEYFHTETRFILAPISCRALYFISYNRLLSIRISSLDSDALREYIHLFKQLRIFCNFGVWIEVLLGSGKYRKIHSNSSLCFAISECGEGGCVFQCPYQIGRDAVCKCPRGPHVPTGKFTNPLNAHFIADINFKYLNRDPIDDCTRFQEVESKGFWLWCITFRITEFLDFVHRPEF